MHSSRRTVLLKNERMHSTRWVYILAASTSFKRFLFPNLLLHPPQARPPTGKGPLLKSASAVLSAAGDDMYAVD